MIARAAVAALALSLTAEGFHLQQKGPEPKLAQANNELTDAGGQEAEWPWSHRRGRQHAEEVPKVAQAARTGRVAVLVSGSLERLLLTPLLANVVRVNAQKGLQVDVFFNLKAPAKLGKTVVSKRQEADDPKIASLLLSGVDEFNFNSTVMDFICELAKAQLASNCEWDLEGDDVLSLPPDATHRHIMTQNNPISTDAGKAVVARWRSLSRMWTAARAKEKEGQEEYNAVLVARGDDYWLAPRVIDIQSFQMDSMQLSAVPCLDSTGINDKAVIMGHDAADVMLRMYQAWQKGDLKLEGTRTAEEVWFRLATESGLNVKPEPMYMALASYTRSGLPCFKESTFNLKQEEGYEQCFAESFEDAPVTSFFSTFSCETMNPNFYDLLWPQQVERLQQVVANLARQHDRAPIVLTVVSQGETEMAVNMLTSLIGTGEEASSLVVGTSTGICKALSDSVGVAGNKCIVVQPAQDVRSSIFKHAILTTVAAAGLSERIVYASPTASFSRPLDSAAAKKPILFAKNLTLARDGKACDDAPSSPDHIDNSVIYLSDAPEVTEVLLRAWDKMSSDDKLSQPEALAAAVQATGYAEFGFLPCGSHSLQSSSTDSTDKILSWEMPPGVAEKMRRQQKKAKANAWVDRMRKASNSTHRERATHAVDDSQRRAAWQNQIGEWKDMWAKRVNELREENAYNETEVKEQRKARRAYNKAHKGEKKHVRYLPPEEAAKVKAKEEKWTAEQEKQRMKDLENAEGRKEAFQREVEKAQAIMDSEDKASDDSESTEEETGAA